ncbi:PspA/IM30 family protein [Pseudoalteromonas luteoviolacea]|uniref:Uncharacterized protein n=1 Tax=Pseudoalteromonas luteoviolacea S4054 TaxID=1129367 RepID=A0A0F6AFG2_9GAMM|nr:hypothetical protein [Pseudoalteromonas luteoviolacea]AOT09851.1 hypothetical protein S4054249_19360 [Pseudoalteromonas luteoviolacea]AOT14763.1 hypothetical protein S40542_19330 [Pseudoalteromonas luteoviolacea]AOT19678.1 hypothetical protein S4054_19335 [Pseudoalteromonas luteoviolacea]KKE84124.1 hypothetical protein N479_11985 [Pseudoalteromonas luteoviolacea S4054]KZN77518.1 hypothetical protein N481_05525 [Pseudoalteromonas luteoviolacea S4047-1]
MALIDRIEDLIKSEFNTLLAQSSNSDVYNGSPSGIDTTTSAIQALIVHLKAEITSTRRQASDCEQAIVQWYEKAQYALERGREDLARLALQEKYRCQNRLTLLQSHIDELSHSLGKLERDNVRLQSRKHSGHHTLKEECLNARLKLKQALNTPAAQNLATHLDEWERRLVKTELRANTVFDSKADKAMSELNRLLKNEKTVAMLQSLKSKLSSELSSNRPSI